MNFSAGIDVLRVNAQSWGIFTGLILLIGTLAFYFTKEKETRILRFLFSVFFIQCALFAVVNLYYFFIYILASGNIEDYLFFFWSFSVRLFLLFFFYQSMIYLNKLKTLDYETFVYTESTEISYFEANNWIRLFHLIFDSLIYFLIAYQLLYFLARLPHLRPLFEQIEGSYSIRTIIFVLSLIFRTLFYFSFERLFLGSPAKFFTETRVVDYEGDKLESDSILKRSLLRSVPFNVASFLFKGNWHDHYSGTQVYNEKRTGIAGGWYFLLIPLFFASVYGLRYFDEIRQRNMMYELAERKFDEKQQAINNGLERLNQNSVLELCHADYASKTLFLKVENISNTTIEFSLLKLEMASFYKNYSIEKAYELSKDTLQRIKISRNDLKKMLQQSFKQTSEYYGDDKEEFKGLEHNPKLRGEFIEKVYEIYSPALSVLSVSTDSESLHIQLQNEGSPAEVISVETLEGEIDWKKHNTFPQAFSEAGFVVLQGKGKNFEDYELKVTVNDNSNKKFVYKISSTDDPGIVYLKLLK
ncbi:RDD family protein [Flavobacterium procerum]|uniref:RDD family protein n=2 Tax=Flavobacterium procerum TaxID=1455569 RepID=A0ABV6BJR7_9FLAO